MVGPQRAGSIESATKGRSYIPVSCWLTKCASKCQECMSGKADCILIQRHLARGKRMQSLFVGNDIFPFRSAGIRT